MAVGYSAVLPRLPPPGRPAAADPAGGTMLLPFSRRAWTLT